MTNARTIAPIFIARTRSFWLGIVPAALTLIDVVAGSVADGTSGPIAGAVAALAGPLTGITAEQVHAFMLAVAPLCALIVAHQRSGLSRPYTSSPAKEKAITQAVVDGKAAFDAGKAIGKALKR